MVILQEIGQPRRVVRKLGDHALQLIQSRAGNARLHFGHARNEQLALLHRSEQLDRFRLRNFIEELGDDELDVHKEPVDLADVAAILHGNPKAVWFRHINGSALQLAGNVVGSRSRLARAFSNSSDPAGSLNSNWPRSA